MKSQIATLNPKGKTPITESVRQAAEALRYTEEKSTVILVSDGLETCDADPCKLAAELAMSGVDFTIHVIGFNVTEEEQARLKCLADRTGGLFLAARNAASLQKALMATVAKAKQEPKPVVEDPGTATLKAPASVTAGSEFKVDWQGPDSHRDFISIFLKKKKDAAYTSYVYTEKGNPAILTAPGKAGAYELRYVHGNSGKVIGKTDIQVTPVAASLTVLASVRAAADVTISWEGPDYPGDYLTIARPKDHGAAYVAYNYTNRGNPAMLRAPSDPGKYEIRYVMANGNQILARAPLAVEKVEAQIEAPESANAASEFKVKWQGPDTQGDYIAIALPTEEGGAYKAYTYTNAGSILKLRGPSDPGEYEVRYILGQGNKIIAKRPITVKAVTASVQPPQTADIASEFEVSWQGPDSQGDYISIALPAEEGGAYKAYTYTNSGSPLKLRAPSDPGEYEVRYILGQGNKIIAKTPITVKAVIASVQAPASAPVASIIQVAWQGPSSNGDYISIATPESDPSVYKKYVYTNTGNPVQLQLPSDPGAYEIRYILGQGDKLLANAAITLTQVKATLSAPGEVAVKSKFQVDWTGPGNNGDYVSIAAEGSNDDQYASYFWVNTGASGELTAPDSPGTYEIRYVLGEGNKVIGKSRIMVK